MKKFQHFSFIEISWWQYFIGKLLFDTNGYFLMKKG
jgi:hypothetical protein